MDLDKPCLEPVKSSLSKFRKRISFKFFEEKFKELTKKVSKYRNTFKGFYIYAVDGQETAIPLSDDVLKNGYRGRAREKNMETYYPRLYLSQIFDVINEITMDVTCSSQRNENRDADLFLNKIEKNSIVLYDRAYISKDMLKAHFGKGNKFIFRCQSGATFREIINFYKSSQRQKIWTFDGKRIRLFKLKNHKTKEDIVFATNLTNEQMSNKDIGKLYLRRWGIETSFRDSVNQAFEQWHSKTVNGLLQEFYVHFWLMNFARMQLLIENPNSTSHWLRSNTYRKANLKLLVEIVVECVPLLLKKLFHQAIRRIGDHIRRTLQRRTHHTRSYERIRRYSRKTFPFKNLVHQKTRC